MLLAAVFACALGIGLGAMAGFIVGRVGFKRIALLWALFGGLCGLMAATAWCWVMIHVIIRDRWPKPRRIGTGAAFGIIVGAAAGLLGYGWILMFWVVNNRFPSEPAKALIPLVPAIGLGAVAGLITGLLSSIPLLYLAMRALPPMHQPPAVRMQSTATTPDT